MVIIIEKRKRGDFEAIFCFDDGFESYFTFDDWEELFDWQPQAIIGAEAIHIRTYSWVEMPFS